MQFSLMIFQSPAHFAERTDPTRREANNAAFGRFVGALHEAGVLITTLGLEPPQTARTLRPDAGGPSIQSGACSATEAQLGGLCVIEAPNLEAALAWARRMPFDHCAAVEVRPTRVVSSN